MTTKDSNFAWVDEAFEKMINIRGIHNKLGNTSNDVKQLRYRLKNGPAVSLQLKLQLLQKSGYKQPQNNYSKKDLIEFAKYWHKCGESTRAMGIEYALEKWEGKK